MVRSSQNKKLKLTIKKPKLVTVNEILKFNKLLKILVSKLVGFFIIRQDIDTVRFCKRCKKFSISSHQSEYIDENANETIKIENKLINIGVCSNCFCKSSKKNKLNFTELNLNIIKKLINYNSENNITRKKLILIIKQAKNLFIDFKIDNLSKIPCQCCQRYYWNKKQERSTFCKDCLLFKSERIEWFNREKAILDELDCESYQSDTNYE